MTLPLAGDMSTSNPQTCSIFLEALFIYQNINNLYSGKYFGVVVRASIANSPIKSYFCT